MNWLERHCLSLEAPAAILHLGAGAGSDLAAWQHFPGSQVILLEPLPDFATQLRQMTAGWKRLTVLQAAVGPTEGHARMRRYNQPLYSSLQAPTGLADLLPGLTRVSELEVETRTLASLADEFYLRPGQENWLILDAPGMEAAVLAELAHWAETPLFTRLFLSAGLEALYEDAQPAEALLTRARELGYAVTGAVDRADPDWPRWHLGLDEALIEARNLQDELESIREKAQKREQAHEARLAELTNQLAEATTALEAQHDEFERRDADARQRIEKLENAVGQAKADLSISLRMQTLRENDLKELQDRYADLLETRNAQHELLLQIRKRLGLAAEYLQQLKHESDEERKSELTSGLVRALAHGFVEESA